MAERPDDEDNLPPETVNREQDDEDAQAQTVADEASANRDEDMGLSDSEKTPASDAAMYGESVQDLVDHMRQMDASGRIDMGAFAGEETMDDLENRYGTENAPDADFAEDDS